MGKSIVFLLFILFFCGCKEENLQQIFEKKGVDALFDEILRLNHVLDTYHYDDTLLILKNNQYSDPVEYVFFIDENQTKYLLKAPFYLSCENDNDLCLINIDNFNHYLARKKIINEDKIIDEFLNIYNYPVGRDYMICKTLDDIDLILRSNNQSVLGSLDVLSKEYLKENVFGNIKENELICWFNTQGLIKFNYTIINGSVSIESVLLGGLGVERVHM